MKLFGTVLFLLLSHSLSAEKKIVAYVPNWVDTRAFAQKIDYQKLTHMNIAFENPANNIMAYDGAGYWSPNSPGQHSSIEFARGNTQYWLDRGLPKAKAILGVPFYGYGFGEAFRKGDYSYATILAKFPGAENQDEVGDKIWYNGMPTIKAKSEYVVAEGLGGMMIWSLDYDVPGDKSLLSTMHSVLNRETVK